MYKGTTIARVAGLLTVTLLAVDCSESLGPGGPHTGRADFAAMASGITLDQFNGTMNESGTMLIKGFNPTNPHQGDAILATFFWLGSTNIITSVTDVLTTNPYTPVGNTYTLVEYVTAGGVSMATYLATNVQNFPDPVTDPGQILAVKADLSAPVTDGGVTISAWTGVNAVAAQALSAHRSASGSSSAPTTADPGALAVTAGQLAYGVTLASALVPLGMPSDFNQIGEGDDPYLKQDAAYIVPGSAGSVDPQWTWYFSSPNTWLASLLVLNPPIYLTFTVQPSNTVPLFTITPAVQVTAVDGSGNPIAGFTGAVTVAIGHNGGLLVPGTLSGTKTVTRSEEHTSELQSLT